MKCEDVMGCWNEAESPRDLPARAKLHLFRCRNCRTEIRSLEAAIGELRSDPLFPMHRDMSSLVMAAIEDMNATSPLSERRKVPMTGWVGTGAVILLSMFLVHWSVSMIWLKGYMGGSLEIPVSIILGLVITLYAALFIGSHLDEFSRRFGIDKERHS